MPTSLMEINNLHKEYSMLGESSVLVHFGTENQQSQMIKVREEVDLTN